MSLNDFKQLRGYLEKDPYSGDIYVNNTKYNIENNTNKNKNKIKFKILGTVHF